MAVHEVPGTFPKSKPIQRYLWCDESHVRVRARAHTTRVVGSEALLHRDRCLCLASLFRALAHGQGDERRAAEHGARLRAAPARAARGPARGAARGGCLCAGPRVRPHAWPRPRPRGGGMRRYGRARGTMPKSKPILCATCAFSLVLGSGAWLCREVVSRLIDQVSRLIDQVCRLTRRGAALGFHVRPQGFCARAPGARGCCPSRRRACTAGAARAPGRAIPPAGGC